MRTLLKCEENKLLVFERKISRIFGPHRDEGTGEWTIRKNDELERLYQMPDITGGRIRKKRLHGGGGWCGLRKRWEDRVRSSGVENSVGLRGIWRVLAENRVENLFVVDQ